MCISCLFDDNFLLTLKIIIDRAMGASGHGKYVVDSLNRRDKGRWVGKWIGYQKLLPQLVKDLVCFIMPIINQLLVLHKN